MEYHYAAYRSPVGVIHLLVGPKGLKAVGLNQSYADFYQEYRLRGPGEWFKVDSKDSKELRPFVKALNEYFSQNKPLPKDIPLDVKATPFQMKVWKALRSIPYGKTATYGQIAAKIGKPKAARAVGAACGSNPLSLFVPCHRVVGSNGHLTGFGGGLEMKSKLLDLENQR